jgi:hypothetical protein
VVARRRFPRTADGRRSPVNTGYSLFGGRSFSLVVHGFAPTVTRTVSRWPVKRLSALRLVADNRSLTATLPPGGTVNAWRPP